MKLLLAVLCLAAASTGCTQALAAGPADAGHTAVFAPKRLAPCPSKGGLMLPPNRCPGSKK